MGMFGSVSRGTVLNLGLFRVEFKLGVSLLRFLTMFSVSNQFQFQLKLCLCGFCSRFALPELQQQCEQYNGDPEDFSEDLYAAQEPNPGAQQSLAETQFLELLRSMWQHEESDGEEFVEAGGTGGGMGEKEDGGEGSGDGEIQEERVNEDELDEIYEFAATQRKMESSAFSTTSDEEEGEEANEGLGSAMRDEEKQNAEAGQRKEALPAFFAKANTSRHSYRPGEDKDAAAMATSAKNVRHTQGARADVCLGSNSADPNPDASLDRSYSRLFSESWGEYVEPSQAPAGSSQLQEAHQQFAAPPRRMTSVSEVIDLSVSPPPGSGEPGQSSLPVAGVSPGEEGAVQNTVPPLSPSTPTSIHSEPSPPVPLGPAASCKHSSSLPSKPKHGLSSSSACNSKPQLSPPVPRKSLPVVSPPEPELIVLSDGSDDMDPDPPADRAGASSPSPSPPRPSQRYTLIRVKKDSIEVPLSSKTTNEAERCKTDLSEGGPCGSGGPSLLDGSAEVSWLIPATPEASSRSSSTQTHSSMRRTRLFPVSRPSSSSSEHSESLRKGPASSRCSSGDSSGSDVPEHSSTFHKPQFVKQTQPSPPSDFMPSSSTPLHSAPCPKPPEALGSPLLRDHKLKPQSKTVWQEEDGDYDEGAALSLSQRVASAKSERKVSGNEDRCMFRGTVLTKGVGHFYKVAKSLVSIKEVFFCWIRSTWLAFIM